ncbi:MAG: tRNA pseudouridine(38-40) synthase TruA [Eubacteriales bacterium]
MRNIKLTIEYDGSRYSGWQKLKDNKDTIQGKIEKVISEMVGKPTGIIASGRTDAGVHARGQIANFHIPVSLSLEEIHQYMNHYLPQDIVIKEIEEVPEKFHSRYHAKKKKYTYYIWNHQTPSVFLRKYSYHVAEKLRFPVMEKAMKQIVGTHDFIGFSSVKKTTKSTVRTIHDIHIVSEKHLLAFTFVGDGFLYNMIRIIMGSLLEISQNKKEISHIDQVFQSGVRAQAGVTVPPQGLFLEEVNY